jgi:hypothetical protein
LPITPGPPQSALTTVSASSDNSCAALAEDDLAEDDALAADSGAATAHVGTSWATSHALAAVRWSQVAIDSIVCRPMRGTSAESADLGASYGSPGPPFLDPGQLFRAPSWRAAI